LTDIVSPPIRMSVIHAFSRSSTLLIARSADNQSWWCRVYAFRKVRAKQDCRTVDAGFGSKSSEIKESRQLSVGPQRKPA
jgi:hypothetical protein